MTQSDLVVDLGTLSLLLAITDLSSDYEKARSKLIKCVKSTTKDNEKYHRRSCEKFYIGKSTIYKKEKQHFDRNDPKTWDTKSLRGRWCKHQKKFQAMIVLAVVKDEQYALDLENTTIAHFMYKGDERLANKTTAAGKCTNSERAKGYVIYLAMKFGPKPCKCGSTTHSRTSHHKCPLSKPCKCGSYSHQRINHRHCPRNKKYKKRTRLLQSSTVLCSSTLTCIPKCSQNLEFSAADLPFLKTVRLYVLQVLTHLCLPSTAGLVK